MRILEVYLLVVSLVAVGLTVYDKAAAIKGRYRIPEKTLFCTAAFGGSLAMLLTMLLIRHKTKHKTFMIGLPIIFILQVVFALFVLYALFENNVLPQTFQM